MLRSPQATVPQHVDLLADTVGATMRLPPWVSGEAYPDWLVPVPNETLVFVVHVQNKATTMRPRLDFSTFFEVEGARCTVAEIGHLTTIALWTIWLLGTEGLGSKPWKPSSLPNAFYVLRRASQWMAREGFGRWDMLGPDDIVRLKEHLYAGGQRSLLGRWGRRYALTILKVLHTLHRRWSLIPDGITFDPEVDDKVVVRRVIRRARVDNPDLVDSGPGGTRSIPWDTAQALLSTAVTMVETIDADAVNDLVNEAQQALYQARRELPQKRVAAFVQAHLRWFGARHPVAGRLMEAYELKGAGAAIDLHRDLMTACYILLASFGALRISEAADLPAVGCINERPDGPWTNTVIIKTSDEILGSNVARVVPPVVRTAVDTALRLTAPHRSEERTELLFSYDHDRALVSLFKARVAKERLIQFAKRRMPGHPEWAYATHQLRKLFAQLYVRRFEGTLPALQQHVGHISNRMIEAYLDDLEIIRMIRDDQKDLTSEIMAGVMLGRSAASGKHAEGWRAAGIEYRAKNMTVAEVSKVVRRRLDGEQMHLEPTGIGYCVSSPVSAASGLCGQNSLGLPDHANRQDGMCLACVNNVSTEANESQLKAEYVLHRQMAESPDAAPPLQEASRKRCLLIQHRLRELQETRQAAQPEACA
ncbi:DNA repair enzyme [Roseomonas mucosa]|uniref:Tyr recombinase domain-containing protein n=3 Tax=Roseomonas TaxID=125216 RepID=A0A379N294_9PROT|nr:MULTISPECIES: site-specific integrase [Acetobacteraceae]MBS5901365.1 site-specific integrase [Acetobacteraceae bacterium]APT57286.1 hypothetical protein RGI145_09405 [Roseomonas gilardii]MCG7350236.1 site-specific integrase [Roseomonas mucosa]MCG7357232.1 site-specific integrase [Roseomonas mucosa]MDT8292770.1 site-specific integrase [Roseomonas mucosa]